MSKRQGLLIIGAVITIATGAAVWRTSVLFRSDPLPPVHVPQPERPDPDAPGELCVDGSGPGPNETIDDLIGKADAVLAVRLVTNRTDRVDLGPFPATLAYTIYDFTVLESVKDNFRAGDSVRIARLGGRGSYEDGFPRPGLGEKFVVFLEWFPKVKAYQHLFGPATTFRIVNGELQPMSWHFRTLQGRKAADVLQELRRVAARHGN